MSGTRSDGKTPPNVRIRTNVPMRPVPSPSNGPPANPLPPSNPIQEYMAQYRPQWSVYNGIAKEAEDRCRQALAENGIPAVISSRAKDPDRLETKIKDRVVKDNKHFDSVAAIEADIVDICGVRVALYFPSHSDRAVRIIQGLFGNAEPKVMPEPRTEKSAPVTKYDTVYRAIHVRATFGTQEAGVVKTLRDKAKIEIQVASLLMHCWSEVNHDLVYKTLGGHMENEDKALIKQLNDLVLSGEKVLETLKNRLEGRAEQKARQFKTPYELATYHQSYSRRKDTTGGTAEQIYRKAAEAREIRLAMNKLFDVVSHLNRNTPGTLEERLDDMMSRKRLTGAPSALEILNDLLEVEGDQARCAFNRPFILAKLNKQFDKAQRTDQGLLDVKIDILRDAFEGLAQEHFSQFTGEQGFPTREYVEFSNYGLKNNVLARQSQNQPALPKADVVEALWRWFATTPHIQLSVALGLGRTRRGEEMKADMGPPFKL